MLKNFFFLSIFCFISCSSSEEKINIVNDVAYCKAWNDIELFANSSEMNSKSDWDKRIQLIESLILTLPDEWKGPGQTYLKIVKARAELLGQYNYVSSQELPNDVLKAFIDKYYEEQKQADKLIDYLKTVC